MIQKFRNILWANLLLVASVFVLLTAQAAFADDVPTQFWGNGAPDWTGEAGYTNQIWEFTNKVTWAETTDALVTPPAAPDTVENPNTYQINDDQPAAGPGLYAAHGEAMMPSPYSWQWVDVGPMGQNWGGVYGMLGGMLLAGGTPGAFDFYVPLANLAGTTSVWLQYVTFVPNGAFDPGNTPLSEATLASDSEFANVVGTLDKRTIDQIHDLDGSGATGDWFRITEEWTVPDAGDVLFLRVHADGQGPTGMLMASMLDSFQVTTRTIVPDPAQMPPEVSSTRPVENGNDVSVDTEIAITFSKRMHKANTNAAFSISPEVAGDVTWSNGNTVMTFTPNTFLTHATQYTVKITTDATDDADIAMDAQYNFSFTTQAYIAPQPQITGTVTGTVDQDSVSITVGGTNIYGYRYRLDNGEWSSIRETSAALELPNLPNGDHTLDIQVRDSKGEWVDTPSQSWTVMVPLSIESVSPRDGSTITPNTIVVNFNQPMDTQSVAGAFSISPETPGEITWEADDYQLVFTPNSLLSTDTQYTVTVGTDARDAAGNALSAPYNWSFTTQQGYVVNCPVQYDTYILFGGMGGGQGYPRGTSGGEYQLKAGAISIVDARALIKFDLSPFTERGLTSENVVAAKLVYTMLDSSGGMNVGAPASDGTSMYGIIHVLDPDNREKNDGSTEAVEEFFWTDEEGGYVDSRNKPGYMVGAPVVEVVHATGPNTSGTFDITPIVKGWLDGRWKNNGIELRDHDDRYYDSVAGYPNIGLGDGFSWHIASREDPLNAPRLEIFYSPEKLLNIQDRADAEKDMRSGENRTLAAHGGNPNDYHWKVKNPNGLEVTATALSAASGANVTFTAPAQPGVYTIILKSGDQSDQIQIGIGRVGEGWANSSRCPLYLSGSTTQEQERLEHLCDDVLEELGSSRKVGSLSLTQEGNTRFIGGTHQKSAANMTVTQIDNPSNLSNPVSVSLKSNNGKFAKIEINPRCAPADVDRIYAVVADTGIPNASNVSGIFLINMYDQNGNPLICDSECGLKVTIAYDPETAGSNPFVGSGENSSDSKTWAVGYAEDLDKFMSNIRSKDEKGTGGVEDIVPVTLFRIPDADLVVDESNHTVTFQTNHCSVFGLMNAASPGVTEPESLGGGCFIQSLLSADITRSHTGLLSKISCAITAVAHKIMGEDF